MTVLPHQTIKLLCRESNPLVTPYEPSQVRTASYDLRMGNEFSLSSLPTENGYIRVGRIGVQDRMVVEVPPNEVIVVRTLEDVHLPDYLVGHLSLKVALMLRGIIMPSQSQIDAGYRGPIFALLYNLSSEPVSLAYEESILRLEFARLDKPTAQTYGGTFRPGYTLANAITKSLSSSLGSIHTELQRTTRTGYASVLTLAGIALAVLSIVAAMLVPLWERAAETGSSSKSAEQDISDLRTEVRDLRRQIDELRSTRPGVSDTRAPESSATRTPE